jgi:hypothetical protein
MANPIQKPFFFGETIQIFSKKPLQGSQPQFFFTMWQNFAPKKMHWLE